MMQSILIMWQPQQKNLKIYNFEMKLKYRKMEQQFWSEAINREQNYYYHFEILDD